ncbi:hypothetical protein ACN6K8_001555 [[Kitasatospora] papulosa]|uniref:hypothetical protein n=1 Tax=Streptomyces TaxID=1883 RepID=UPI00117F51F7
MAEQWGQFITGSIGLVGVLAGIYVGRWQVTHQARVEHGQWLRAQRQEAQLALLDAWVTCMTQFQEMVDRDQVQVEHHMAETYEGDGWAASEDRIWRQTESLSQPARNALERVELLGPENVDTACSQLAVALTGMIQATRLEAGNPTWPDQNACSESWKQADTARTTFLTACRVATRTAPAPRRQRN